MSKECSKFSNQAKAQNPFQTKSGSFYIKRPRRTDEGETQYEVVPLDSPSTRMYLKAIFGPLTSRGFVTEAEFRTIVEMIKGIAIEQPLGELSDCGAETIQHKPVLQGLLLMASKGPFRESPANLLAKVATELRLNGIVVDDPTFPTTEDAFGRQTQSPQGRRGQDGADPPAQRDRPAAYLVRLSGGGRPALKCRK